MATVTVFGGTGFLGRRVVRHLVAGGADVRVAVRHPDAARDALRDVFERLTIIRADVRDPPSVAAGVAGSEAVVNAVSAYVEKGSVTFESVHVEGAKALAREASAAGAKRLVLVSGIGSDAGSPSPYIRARGRGEQVVRQAFPSATIVRPSTMFGPGDALFGTLAQLARWLPAMPLIGGGHARMQPVYVEDVAEAIARIVANEAAAGQIYELAGPTAYTMRELVELVLRIVGRRRLLLSIPFAVAEAEARLFELLPSPPLTTGQVDLLKADNVASGKLPGLHELGITPKSAEDVVPTYIGRSKR